MIPKPVLTSKGLCFALNARKISEIYKESKYINNFQTVFGNNDGNDIFYGNKKTIELEIDMQSKYLYDRSNQTGSFWSVYH